MPFRCARATSVLAMPFVAFKMTNNIAFNKLNAPEWGILVAGGILSAIGMLVGIRIGRVP